MALKRPDKPAFERRWGDHKDFVIVPLNTSIEARPILLEHIPYNIHHGSTHPGISKDVLIGGFYEKLTLTIVHKCRITNYMENMDGSYSQRGFILTHNCPTETGTSGALLLSEKDLSPIALHNSGSPRKGATYDDSHREGNFNAAMPLNTIIEAINSNCEFLKGHATR